MFSNVIFLVGENGSMSDMEKAERMRRVLCQIKHLHIKRFKSKHLLGAQEKDRNNILRLHNYK